MADFRVYILLGFGAADFLRGVSLRGLWLSVRQLLHEGHTGALVTVGLRRRYTSGVMRLSYFYPEFPDLYFELEGVPPGDGFAVAVAMSGHTTAHPSTWWDERGRWLYRLGGLS